jgi:hypothetical protein
MAKFTDYDENYINAALDECDEIKEKDKKLMKIIIKRSLNQGLSYDFDDYNKILSGEVGSNDKD